MITVYIIYLVFIDRYDALYEIMVLFKQTDCMDRTGFGEVGSF